MKRLDLFVFVQVQSVIVLALFLHWKVCRFFRLVELLAHSSVVDIYHYYQQAGSLIQPLVY